jgi:hypothetical protein
VTLLDEQRRRDGRIHAARHRYDNAHLIKGKPRKLRKHETSDGSAFHVSPLVFNTAS